MICCTCSPYKAPLHGATVVLIVCVAKNHAQCWRCLAGILSCLRTADTSTHRGLLVSAIAVLDHALQVLQEGCSNVVRSFCQKAALSVCKQHRLAVLQGRDLYNASARKHGKLAGSPAS